MPLTVTPPEWTLEGVAADLEAGTPVNAFQVGIIVNELYRLRRELEAVSALRHVLNESIARLRDDAAAVSQRFGSIEARLESAHAPMHNVASIATVMRDKDGRVTGIETRVAK